MHQSTSTDLLLCDLHHHHHYLVGMRFDGVQRSIWCVLIEIDDRRELYGAMLTYEA